MDETYALVVALRDWLVVREQMLRCNWTAEYHRDDVTVRFTTRHAMRKCEALVADRHRKHAAMGREALEELGAELTADIAEAKAAGAEATVRKLSTQLAAVTEEWMRRYGNETPADKYARSFGNGVPAVNTEVRGV